MRSGHHAVVNWIYQNLQGNVVFANNVCGILWNSTNNDDRYNKFLYLFKSGLSQRENLIDINCSIEKCHLLPLINRGDIYKIKYLIATIEDDSGFHFINGNINQNHKLLNFVPTQKHKSIGIGCGKIVNVIVLRDAFNFMASRYKRNQQTEHDMIGRALHDWKIHAKEFLGYTHNLDNLICINFNKWVYSISYKKKIAKKLNMPYSEKGFYEVPKYGNGSSFSGLNYLKSRDVLHRWKIYANDINFQNLFDSESLSLNKKIFGKIFDEKILFI